MNKQVEQIKTEIERRLSVMPKSAWGTDELKRLLSFIDSLQEEFKPKFKVGQTITDPTDSTFTFHINKIEDGRYIEKEDEWVLIKEADANYELVEEPINEDLEAAATEYSNGIILPNDALMCKAAYIAGAQWKQQQMMKSAKLDGWIARDEDDRLHLFEVEPRRFEKEHRWWDRDYHSTGLDESDFPDLKWEDEPIYVKLAIIEED